jgi:ribosomal protein L37E
LGVAGREVVMNAATIRPVASSARGPAESPPDREAFTAVCYRCRSGGHRPEATRCPQCGFPLIVKRRELAEDGLRVRDIFDRTSVSVNAPPLPGVDGAPRKAQLLAEARRRRREAARRPPTAPALPADLRLGVRHPGLKVCCAFLSALGAGVVVAMLMNGGL